MQKKYENFEENEMADGTYLIAEPVARNDEPIRIDTGWFEGEAGEKHDWEYVVGEIVASDLQEDLQLEEGGEGTIDREHAIQNILTADLTEDQSVIDRQQAEAVIDYFVEEGALTQKSSGEIVVLQDPTKLTEGGSEFDSSEREYHILSWAAAIDTCIDYMQETLDTFEQARERLEEETEQVSQNDVSETEKQVVRIGQELKSLGPGAEVPDPSQLSADQQERYETLKEDFAYYKSLYEVKQEQLVTAEKGMKKLRRNIDKLRSAKEVYDDKVKEMRKAALQKQVFPSENIEAAKNMAGLITSLSTAANPDDMQQKIGDGQELNEVINNTIETADDVVGEAEQGLSEEETQPAGTEESGLQME